MKDVSRNSYNETKWTIAFVELKERL